MRVHMIQRMLLSSGLLGLTGCCGICGEWRSVGVRPAGATDFNMASATFNCDGTYEAAMHYDGQDHKSKGTYTHKWNELKLWPEAGPMREYDAKLHLSGKKLDIEYEREDQRDIHVEMQRVGCTKDCCCKKCGGKHAAACPPGCTKPCCKKA